MRSLMWFRTDLRATDNPALVEAAKRATRGLVGLYVISPEEWQAHDEAACKVDLWLRTLRILSATLGKRNIALVVRRAERAGDVAKVVADAAAEFECGAVCWNRQYEVDERARDGACASLLRAAGRGVHEFNDQCGIAPGEVRTREGRFYTVFTPFKRAWITAWEERGGATPAGPPRKQAEMIGAPSEIPPRVTGFESGIDSALWSADEGAAMKRLGAFIESRIRAYKDSRDLPEEPGTSGLSPALACGAISTRQCLAAAIEANRGRLTGGQAGIDTWITELIWREFYRNILVGFPRVCRNQPFKLETKRIAWSEDDAAFEAWKAGRTGVPIVDAAMRALRAEGWMHNRLRMVTAMFLTKNLFIDWRRGERWFMRNLIDGDLASNNGGWQWSASTGTDAAPYFRIFNPVSQSRRFDPRGAFIRRWVPELAELSDEDIHDPAALPELARLRIDYPEPIVDLAASRARAITAFKALGASLRDY